MMTDYGWSYYSNKVRLILGEPKYLKDTIIDNVVHKIIKFNFIGDDAKKIYKVGYLRCDGKGELFSLEKRYSKSLGCVMTKFEDFQIGQKIPIATMELEFFSDSLSKQEIKVFDAWEKKEYPVTNK